MFSHLSSTMKNLFLSLLAIGPSFLFGQAPSMTMPGVDSANFIAIEGCYCNYGIDTLLEVIEFSLVDDGGNVVLNHVLCDSFDKVFLPVGLYTLEVHDFPKGYSLPADSLSSKEGWDNYYYSDEGEHYSPMYVGMKFPVQVVDSFHTTISLPTRDYDRTYSSPYNPYERPDNSASGGAFLMKYGQTSNSGITHWTQFGWTVNMFGFNPAQNMAVAFEQGMEFNYGWNDTPAPGFDRSRYTYFNYNLGPFVRVVANQKKYSHGAFIDLGTKYYVPYAYRRTEATWTTNSVNKWLHRWDDWRVFTRVGFDWFSLTAEYAVLNSTESGAHPLPRLNVGMAFMIDGNPWGAKE